MSRLEILHIVYYYYYYYSTTFLPKLYIEWVALLALVRGVTVSDFDPKLAHVPYDIFDEPQIKSEHFSSTNFLGQSSLQFSALLIQLLISAFRKQRPNNMYINNVQHRHVLDFEKAEEKTKLVTGWTDCYSNPG